MLIPLIFDDRAASLSRVPPQSGQVVNVTARSTNARMCGCIASTSLDRNDFWICRDQARVRQVDAVDLDLGRLLVEQVVQLLLGELADRLVRVEEAAAAEDAAVPAVHAVAGDRERTLVERLAVVVQRGQVEVGDRAHALAARAHAAGAAERALLDLSCSPPFSTVIAPAPLTVAVLKENALGEPMCGLPSRLNRMRSIALASVAVPTVERGLAPIRSWSTMIAVVSPSSTSTSGRASVGMKPCTKAL